MKTAFMKVCLTLKHYATIYINYIGASSLPNLFHRQTLTLSAPVILMAVLHARAQLSGKISSVAMQGTLVR